MTTLMAIGWFLAGIFATLFCEMIGLIILAIKSYKNDK